MNPKLIYILCGLASYLLGAVPFGFLIGLSKGIDIRTLGSGNIGATNVFRTVSKSLGVISFILDVLKGLLSALVIPMAAAYLTGIEVSDGLKLLCGFMAVAGHNWPVYLRFKGGKGIATTAGALLGIAPCALAAGFVVWLASFLIGRYVSLASIIAAAVIPAFGWVFYRENGLLLPCALTLLGVLGICRHRTNINRLLKGTESRFQFGKKKDS
jgi:glycerol-3-phosphate acyltransferase PlsY